MISIVKNNDFKVTIDTYDNLKSKIKNIKDLPVAKIDNTSNFNFFSIYNKSNELIGLSIINLKPKSIPIDVDFDIAIRFIWIRQDFRGVRLGEKLLTTILSYYPNKIIILCTGPKTSPNAFRMYSKYFEPIGHGYYIRKN